MLYYACERMCVCVCTTSAENELFLFNVSYILFFIFFFYSVICYAHYRSTVSLSFQCPTRTCIIIIMCTDRIARDVYGHYFSFPSSILRCTTDPRRLFFFSNGRMMSIIMHFFSLAQITLLYDPPSFVIENLKLQTKYVSHCTL